MKGSTKDFIDILLKDCQGLAQHIHIARWQQDRFPESVSKCEANEVIELMEFAQNYSCTYQHEAQGAHWGHNQVTIHLVVTYYKCPRKMWSDCSWRFYLYYTWSETRPFRSEGIWRRCNLFLETERGLAIEIKTQYTDGCASQYKSVNAFKDSASDTKNVTRNFFGSRHGKGPSDAVTGYVKGTANRVVRKGEIIGNAEDQFHFCAKKLDRDLHCETHRCVKTMFFWKHWARWPKSSLQNNKGDTWLTQCCQHCQFWVYQCSQTYMLLWFFRKWIC